MATYFAEQLIPDEGVLRLFEGDDDAGNPITAEGFLVEAAKVGDTGMMRLTVEPRRPQRPHCPDPDAHPASPAVTIYVGLGPVVADRKFRITWTTLSEHTATVDAATLAELTGYHDIGELADAIADAGDVQLIETGEVYDALAATELDAEIVGLRREDIEISDTAE